MPEEQSIIKSSDPAAYLIAKPEIKKLKPPFFKRKSFLIIFTAVVITFLLAILVLMIFKNQKEPSKQPATKTIVATPSVSISTPSAEEATSSVTLFEKEPPRKLTDNVGLDLYAKHYQILKKPDAWLEKLNDAYLALEELVGDRPFDGEKIIIKEVKDLEYGEMVAGNPIQWWDTYVPEKLTRINQKNDLSFGPIHEMSHDFDLYFSSSSYLHGSADLLNVEQWANFKLTYVANILAKKYPTATFYQSAVGSVSLSTFTDKYFVDIFAKEWLASSKKDWTKMKSDAFTGLLYTLAKKYGWSQFKQTFREYSTSNFSVPVSDLGKLQLLADTLSKHAGKNILTEFQKWGIPVK